MSIGEWGLADVKGVKGIHRYWHESEDIEGVVGIRSILWILAILRWGVWCHGASSCIYKYHTYFGC